MPTECCNRYGKYIAQDGKVKETFLEHEFGKEAVVTITQPEPSDFAVQMIKLGHDVVPPRPECIVQVGGVEHKLCMCDCHKDGCNCIH